MHRKSYLHRSSVLVPLLLLAACARNPSPAPGKIAPAVPAVATPPAPPPTTFACATDGAAIAGDEAGRVCVPYAGTPRGDAQGLVTVVAFSDFQCPFCSRVLPTLEKLEQAYPGKLRFYFRHFPLAFHSNAKLAAQAAVAAENQGRFWAMHDFLFSHQRELGRESLLKYAEALSLDMKRFAADLDAAQTRKRIADDLALAKALGLQGTPTFFINGRSLPGAVPIEEFKKLVDQELQRAQKMGMQSANGYSFYAALMKGQGKGDGKGDDEGPGEPQAQAPAPTIPVGTDVFNVQVGGPQQGGKEPKVTLVAFLDFQCHYCGRAKTTLDELAKRYKDDLLIVFRHYPLAIHQNAMGAALAAVAAAEQNKFWQMCDLLFANQQALETKDLEKYAVTLGLDLAKYRVAVGDPKNRAHIEEDLALGTRLGVAGTPSFFVNGRRFAGAYPLDSFVAVIDQEMNHADALLAKGTPRAGLYAAITKDGLDKAPLAKEAAREGAPQPGQAYRVDVKDAPMKGAKNALVTIVEFSDFECPYCQRVESTQAQVLKAYPGKVRLAWRNLPLPFHTKARPAAVAAMAAGRQGKFWQMHDLLFAHQQELDDDAIKGYAKELRLDMAKFEAALLDEKIAHAIDQDGAAAARFGVRGTPAFFINGTFLSGAQPFERFKERIDEELGKANALVKKGTPTARVYDVILKRAKAEVERPAPAGSDAADERPVVVDVGNAPSRGPASAPVTLVVFSDLQCPFCSRLEATLAVLEKSYPGKLRVVWKNFPLAFHEHGKSSAEAAMAAHEQGKFWAMQAMLFQHQDALDDSAVEGYAGAIGLDMGKYKNAMASHKFAAAVEADMRQGESLGVEGTPATFVNGHLVSGAQPAEAFKARVESELAKVRKR